MTPPEGETTHWHPAGGRPDQEPDGSASELVRVLDGYLADLQAGRAPDRAHLLAENPGLAGMLESCLAGIDFIHQAAGPANGDLEEGPARLGDFRIVREVGRGGMGVVFEAEQLSLRRRVALKVLRFGPSSGDPEAMERFRREAQTVARLHHTNIVPVFASGSEGGVHYYAMQFIEGRSLADVLDDARRRGRPLPPAEAAGWALQAAGALEHAHRRGVVHRDVKPSNLLLDPEGIVWLTDFGLARRADEAALTLTGALLGTPRYMSPEQAAALGRPVDARTDIYSLGATLYELATGRPLFEAESPHAMLARIADPHAEPARPRVARPGLPRDLETILLKCLAKDPAGRYPTAQALADDLRALLDGRPIRARRVGPIRRAARWASRQRRSAALAVASAAVAVTLVAAGNLAWTASQAPLTLLTSTPHLSAEVLDADTGAPVRPEFSLPTRRPVALPAGSYAVRVSGEGRPDETFRLDPARGEASSYRVEPASRRPWEPFPADTRDRVEPIDLEQGKDDLVVVRSGSLRRLDGATGRAIWAVGARSEGDGATASITITAGPPEGQEARLDEERRRLAFELGIGNLPARLARPAPDLDGDGVGDLVWAFGHGARLWAVSGRDGSTLWLADRGPGAALMAPAVADLDGDGTPDLLAAFAEGGRRWVEAASGRSGEAIWTLDLDPEWAPAGSSRRDRDDPIAAVARLGGRPAVVVAAGRRFLRLEPATGEAAVSLDLGSIVAAGSRLGDLDGDGTDEAVVLLAGPPGSGDVARALDLGDGRTRWERPLGATLPLRMFDEDAPVDWPLVVDLDGDGAAEVVVPATDSRGVSGGPHDWAGVEVVRGRDGSTVWRRTVTPSKYAAQVDRFAAGPDLDGDGVRELFLASIGSAWRREPGEWGDAALHVDAISGRDGSTLWWWRHPAGMHVDRIAALRWWGPGADGWPRLVVGFIPWGGPTPWASGDSAGPVASVFALSAGSGRAEFTLPKATAPAVADLDGDGTPDLAYRIDRSDVGPDAGGRFAALLGSPPTPWRRLGRAVPARDLDGDGVTDLVEPLPGAVAAVSGADGRPLWRSTPGWVRGFPGRVPWPQVEGSAASILGGAADDDEADLDGDGTPDLLVGPRDSVGFWDDAEALAAIPLQAVSGRTGRPIWEPGSVRLPAGRSHVFGAPRWARCVDLDGDGRPDVLALILTKEGPSSRIWLAWISGRNGRVVRRDLVAEDSPQSSLPMEHYRTAPVVADLDGDGRPEVLATALVGPQAAFVGPGGGRYAAELRAYPGDGSTPWVHRLADRIGTRDSTFDLPAPLVGDLDGDGRPEVVVADAVDPSRPEAPGPNVSVVALSGRDGRRLWGPWLTRDDELGQARQSGPALVRLGDGRSAVVVRATRGNADVLTLLDGSGRPVGERAFERNGSGPWRYEVRAADLDGDGADELVVPLGSWQTFKVVALRGGLDRVAWEWSTREGRLVGIRPASGGRAAEVVVGLPGDAVVALDGRTGRAAWRGLGVPWSPPGGPPMEAPFLETADPNGPPLVAARSFDATTCLATLPGGPIEPGRALPGAAPIPGPAPDDPRMARPLPWVFPELAEAAPWIALAPLASIALLVLPARLLGRLLGSGRIGVAGLMALTAAGALALGASRAWGLEPISRVLLFAAFGLPILAFVGLSARWAAGRQWRRLGWLLVLWVALAPVAAVAWLWGEFPALEPGQYHRSVGWPLLALPAAYAAGMALCAGLALRWAWRAVRWAWRGVGRLRARPAVG